MFFFVMVFHGATPIFDDGFLSFKYAGVSPALSAMLASHLQP